MHFSCDIWYGPYGMAHKTRVSLNKSPRELISRMTINLIVILTQENRFLFRPVEVSLKTTKTTKLRMKLKLLQKAKMFSIFRLIRSNQKDQKKLKFKVHFWQQNLQVTNWRKLQPLRRRRRRPFIFTLIFLQSPIQHLILKLAKTVQTLRKWRHRKWRHWKIIILR